MAKSSPSKRASQPHSAKSAAETAPRFSFDHFCLLNLQFHDLSDGGSIQVDAGSPPGSDQAGIELRMGIDEHAKRSELRMTLSLLPPPGHLPYRVSVEVLGRFSTPDGTVDQLRQFTQENAPVILFPFVRAVVYNATAEACRGPLRMNPMDLRGLIKPGGWSDQPRPEQSSARPTTSSAARSPD